MSIVVGRRWGHPLTIPVRNALLAAFVLVLALLALAIGVSIREARRFEGLSRLGLQANATVLELERTLSAMRDAETGQRGYLLTGDTLYLAPYQSGMRAVGQHLSALGRLSQVSRADITIRPEELLRMQHLVEAKRHELQQSLALYQQEGLTPALAEVRSDTGRAVMDSLRVLVGVVEARQTRALTATTASWRERARRNYTAVEALAVVGLVLIATMLYAANLVLAERRARQEALTAERALLEQRVAERTEELHQQHQVAVGAQRRAEQAAVQAEEETVRAEEEAARAEEERLRADEERQRAELHEAEARVGESRYRALAELSPDALLVLVDGIVVYANPAAARLIGAPHTRDLVGMSGFDFVVPKYADAVRDRMRLVVEEGRNAPPLEYQWRRMDGKLEEVETAAGPVDWQGRRAIQVVARAIGDRRRAVLALAESEARFRAMADTAPVMIWQADADGACTFVNRGWLTFTGRTLEQEQGEGWADCIHPEDRDRSLAAFRQAYAQRAPFSIEYRFRRSDGVYRLVRNDGVPRRADDATFVGFVGACLDVTEMREASRRLGEAQRLESLGRLAGGVAHETNNQMTVVLGAAEFLLRRTDLAPTAREDVGQIRQAAERAANVSAQLLAYSRRSLLRPQVLDLNTVVAGIQPALRRVLGGERTLLVELAPAAGPVEADPGQLEQVLLNLIINARDAMEEGGRVTIATGQTRVSDADAARRPELAGRAGLYARLTVTDTGRGMSAETVSRVFEPFFTTKPVGQGTGLGLATVYGIVKQSNGFIWATSEEGRGTSFEILLPVVAGARPARLSTPQPVVAGAAHVILVVEDEDSVREFAVRGLQEAGFTVLSATGGTEALALVDRDRPALSAIVTDLAMPGLDGGALAEQLRQRYPSVPVLYMSGFTDDDVVRRGLLEPEQPFLQKPFGPDELARRVKALVEGEAAG